MAAALLEERKGLHHGFQRPRARPARRACDEEIFLDRQASEQSPSFRNEGDAERGARVSASGADILALERDGARGVAVRAGDRPEKRRLAGPVRADERDRLAPFDRQAHAAHGLKLAVARFEPFDGEQRHTAPPPR